MGRIIYFQTVLGELGGMLEFISPLTILPLLVAILFREWAMALPLALVPGIFFASGALLNRLPRTGTGIRLSAALCSLALVWLAFAAISGIPFIMALGMPVTDALFESMAGWTGTGFSIISSAGAMPQSLVFWRIYMQWLGGLGVVALTISQAQRAGFAQSSLFRSESRSERILPSVVATGKQIWGVYILLTVISIGLILMARVPLWDAITLALSTISTGGFSPHPGGLLYYQNPFLETLLIPVMILGSTPFSLYYMTYRRKKVSFFADEQVRLLFAFLVAGSAIVAADLFFIGQFSPSESLRQGVFMTAAAISTTGFQTGNPYLYPSVTVVFLTMLMFIGGASGSTAGGVRLSRIAVGYRGIVWWFRRTFVRARVLVPFQYEGQTIPEKVAEPELAKNMLVIILSVLIVFIATMIVLQVHVTSFDVTDVVFDIVSALSSCGISTGYVNSQMPFITKWVFFVVMWIGRLEVIPVIVLFMGILRGHD